MSNIPDKDLAALFRKYLSTRKVLIADPLRSSRSALYKNIIDMGARPESVFCTDNYVEAAQILKSNKPLVVLSEYELGKSSGLELMQSFRAQNKDTKEYLFALITDNASQSVVAQAAEEDVDTFILKPFTTGVLRQNLLKAATVKINPSNYLKTIKEGKDLLDAKKIEEARVKFTEAVKLDSKPTLAIYYIGETYFQEQNWGEAQKNFEQGLSLNKLHFRCLNGLFDTLMAQKIHADAYEVAKRLARYYPANPKRLSTVLKLAIVTKSLDDIERYYQIFLNIDQKEDELIQYVCAALVVCGKHYLKTNFHFRGLELLKNAGATAGKRMRFWKEIIVAHYQFQFFKEAQEHLRNFPEELKETVEFQALEYLLNEREWVADESIKKGKLLSTKKPNDPLIGQVLLNRLSAEKRTDEVAKILSEYSAMFPDKKTQLEAASGGKLMF